MQSKGNLKKKSTEKSDKNYLNIIIYRNTKRPFQSSWWFYPRREKLKGEHCTTAKKQKIWVCCCYDFGGITAVCFYFGINYNDFTEMRIDKSIMQKINLFAFIGLD